MKNLKFLSIWLFMLCQSAWAQKMSVEEISPLIQAPGDSVPLIKPLRVYPRIEKSSLSMEIKFPDKTVRDKMQCRLKTVEGRYRVTFCVSAGTKTETFSVISYNASRKTYSINVLYPNSTVAFYETRYHPEKNKFTWRVENPGGGYHSGVEYLHEEGSEALDTTYSVMGAVLAVNKMRWTGVGE